MLDENKRNALAHFKYNEKLTNGLSFSMALEALKCGLCINRRGWNGKGLYVKMYDNIALNCSYEVSAMLILHYPNETVFTWVPSISDLLANDWEVFYCD